VQLRAASSPIDIVTVGSRLKELGRIEQVGGMSYLTEILNSAPAVVNVTAYATTVHNRWRERQAIAACQRVAARGYLGVDDTQRYLETATKALALLSNDNPLAPVPTNEQTLAKLLKAMTSDTVADERAATMQGYPTGLHTLDRHLGGLAAGHKLTVAATSGVGKTAFAGQIAVHVAKLGVAVVMFSTEVTREEVLQRCLANESGVGEDAMKAKKLTSGDITRVFEAAERLRHLPFVIDETPDINVETIRARVASHVERARLINRAPLGLVIVDYVQRLSPSPGMHRSEKHARVAHQTKALKQLAQHHRLTVLELAQAKEFERDKRTKRLKLPSLDTGISDSKEIKNEADEVIFLMPQAKLESGAVDVTAYLAKQRGGKKGVEVSLEFHGPVYRFEDPDDPLRCASRDFLEGMGVTT